MICFRNQPFTCVFPSPTGLPPADILEDVCRAWERAGLDVVECLRRAVSVTNDSVYTPTAEGDVRSRLTQRVIKEMTVPVVLKPLEHIVNAQPRALAVIRKLLDWISRVDLASQQGVSTMQPNLGCSV